MLRPKVPICGGPQKLVLIIILFQPIVHKHLFCWHLASILKAKKTFLHNKVAMKSVITIALLSLILMIGLSHWKKHKTLLLRTSLVAFWKQSSKNLTMIKHKATSLRGHLIASISVTPRESKTIPDVRTTHAYIIVIACASQAGFDYLLNLIFTNLPVLFFANTPSKTISSRAFIFVDTSF